MGRYCEIFKHETRKVEAYPEPQIMQAPVELQGLWLGIYGQIAAFFDDVRDEGLLKFCIYTEAIAQLDVEHYTSGKIEMGNEVYNVVGGSFNGEIRERSESYATRIYGVSNESRSIFGN